MANTTFNRWFLPSIWVEMWIYFVHHSPWRVRSGIWCKQMDLCFGWSEGSCIRAVIDAFNQHKGAIYLRLKYLAVKISSDVVTKHYCQVCVLFLMFCPAASWLTWQVIVHSGKLSTTWFDFTPIGQRGKWYEKYSLHSIFTFCLKRDTSVLELFHVVAFQ